MILIQIHKNQKVETRPLLIPDDIESVIKLWFNYLSWGKDTMQGLCCELSTTK